MAVTVGSILNLVLVAMLWGITNPFIKKGAQGLENITSSTVHGQFFKEISFLVTNYKYMIPFLINQGGSVLYFLTLQSTDLSLAIPVSNALTFIITAVTGYFLGEEKINRNTYLGMILILLGTNLCCFAKFNHQPSSSND